LGCGWQSPRPGQQGSIMGLFLSFLFSWLFLGCFLVVSWWFLGGFLVVSWWFLGFISIYSVTESAFT
jgi:hypothetical protein